MFWLKNLHMKLRSSVNDIKPGSVHLQPRQLANQKLISNYDLWVSLSETFLQVLSGTKEGLSRECSVSST